MKHIKNHQKNKPKTTPIIIKEFIVAKFKPESVTDDEYIEEKDEVVETHYIRRREDLEKLKQANPEVFYEITGHVIDGEEFYFQS